MTKGFTLLEILIVMIIAGLGFMTIAPKIAENTILSNKTEVFFEDIIESHLKTAAELNTRVFVTGFVGSSSLVLESGERVQIPAGEVKEIMINHDYAGSSEFRIYFYTDGIFDQFEMTFKDNEKLESVPALHKVILK